MHVIDGRALVAKVALRWKPQGREGMRRQTQGNSAQPEHGPANAPRQEHPAIRHQH